MAINLEDTKALQELDLEALIADAVERKDKEALRWLEDETNKTITRTNKKSGKEYETVRSIVSIRSEYLTKFLRYNPKSKQKEEEKKERKAKIKQMFADAFAQLD